MLTDRTVPSSIFRPIRWVYYKDFGWSPSLIPLPLDGKIWFKAVQPDGEDQKLVLVEITNA